MKYLIVGLGNIGPEYDGTRHNIGFRVLDALSKASNTAFEDRRYGFVAHMRVKNAELVLLKPSTYMNLSGNAVRYWLLQEKIPVENMLVVVDDLSLPLGTIRLRQGGGDGGHNGLKSIQECLGSQRFARIRIGIGNDFQRGEQIDFVLGALSEAERAQVPEICTRIIEGVRIYCTAGPDMAMSALNIKK